MKIRLCDDRKDGHHQVYFNSLLKIKGTYLYLSKEQMVYSLKKNFFKYFQTLNCVISDFVKKNNSNNEIIHLLTMDFLYMYPFLKKNNIIGTLHHIPKNFIKKIFLRNFSKRLKYIVVHSTFLKEEMKKIGIKNVKVINYPSFYNYENLDKEQIKLKLDIMQDKLVLSCLGGTRKDKGLNIFLESMRYLSLKTRKKIIINIAGNAEYYKKEFIEKYKKLVDLRLDLRILSENEFKENVIITDVMIIPYLKYFTGNSGPMTEAIVNKIPCITPRELNIGKINTKNNLGEVFECENPKSLAKAIEKIIENLDKGIYYTTSFYKELTEEKFLEEYRKIYKEVWSEIENG